MTTGQKVWTVVKMGLARLRFIAVFVVAALLVGYWHHLRAHVDKWAARAQCVWTNGSDGMCERMGVGDWRPAADRRSD